MTERIYATEEQHAEVMAAMQAHHERMEGFAQRQVEAAERAAGVSTKIATLRQQFTMAALSGLLARPDTRLDDAPRIAASIGNRVAEIRSELDG